MNLSHIQARMREICPSAGVFGMADYSGWNNRALEDRLLDLSNEASAIRATAERQNRDLTESEAQEIDRVLAAFEEVEAELGSRGSKGRKTAPGQPGSGPHNAPRSGGIKADDPRIKIIDGSADRRFSAILGQKAKDNGGFETMDEFLSIVARNQFDPRLIANATMTEGSGVDGGFLVPAILTTSLLDASLESEAIRPRATVIVTPSNNVQIGIWDHHDRSTSVGGLTGNWLAENSSATPQKMKFRLLSFKLRKLALYTEASWELVEDGLNFETQITSAMTQALGYYLDSAFINGTGAGQPLGLLNCPAKITVGKGATASGTISAINLFEMYGRLHPSCARNAVWLMSPSAYAKLLQTEWRTANNAGTDTVSGSLVFMPGSMAGAPNGTLLGRPIIISEVCNAVGTEGDVILADLSQYYVAIRHEMTIERDTSIGWNTHTINWRAILRVEGLDSWGDTITPKGDSTTLSWLVTLESR